MDPDLRHALRAYALPLLHDGDAVLFLDHRFPVEVAGLADAWDDELRAHTAGVLRACPVDAATLAVARPEGRLRESDHLLWAQLRQDLDGQVELAPLLALPARADPVSATG